MKKYLWAALLGGLGWVGCDRSSEQVPVPAYIYVESIQFAPQDPNREGSASHRITDAWVSVDGQLVGTNVLPALLPVILNDSVDNHEITIRAGIEKNGISASRSEYRVFNRYSEFRRLQPGKVDTVRAVVGYDPDCVIELVENFEGAGIAFGEELDGNSQTVMTRQQTDVFEGDYSGRLLVDSGNLECRLATTAQFANIQPSGTAFSVYLEMHYKTELPIQVGVIAHYANGSTQTYYKGGVNPVGFWNKVYFDLTEDIFRLNAASYSIVLLVQNTSRQANPQVLIDNVKLVHY